MEVAAVNMPHKRRQKPKVTIARKKTFPRRSQRTSSEQAIDEQRVSSVASTPTASFQAAQVDSVTIDVDEHRANETQPDEREQTSQIPTNYINIRDSLYPAAIKGDWQSVKKYRDDAIWELPITQQQMNTLQVAVAAKQIALVTELLNCMTARQLEFVNANGDTALAITALLGSVKIAEKMVKMNCRLPMIRNEQKHLPLLIAAMHRHRDMVLYLYSVTEFEELTPDERLKLLLHVIFCDMYDIANAILEKTPTLAEDENGCMALEQLARKPFAIGSRSRMSAWERCIGSCFKRVYQKALMRKFAHQLVEDIWKKARKLPLKQLSKYSSTIFLAAELGNVEFLTILIRSDPDLIWRVDENNRNIFHISILYRQESIFNLIHEIGVFKNMIATICDKNKNNMLHLAGKLPPVDRLNIVSGAALHMQRELLWFKEIEKIVPLAFLKAKNSKGQTPKDLFTKTHQNLHKDGEKWMRDTAMHCMVVATLIATVVFAATFTVPGGNDQGKGIPIFLERNWFVVFFISDSIALISSSTSILIFLSILTSRYTEKDFLSSLPRRLMFGLTALFISIVGMVVAFGATCFLVYQRKMTRVPTVIIALASVPISSFVLLHYELLVDIISSTYLSRFLFRSRKRMFC